MFEITPESAFTFTKLSVSLIMSWPPSENASRINMIIFDIKWWILWLNSIVVVMILISTAYNGRHDILLLTKYLCISASCIQYPIKMFICKMMRRQLQLVLGEMQCYVRDAELHEREMFLVCIKKCGIIHVAYVLVAWIAVAGFIFGPLILPQSLPIDATYPFPIDTHPIFDIVYIQQIIGGMQNCTVAAIDCQIAMMFWYIVVRLKILEKQMKRVENANELSTCIQNHQYLLWLSEEVINIGRYILLTTVMMTALTIIFGGIPIVGKQPIVVKLQFSIIVATFCALLFVNAWPSEELIRSSENLGLAIYESNWTAKNFSRTIIFVIQRARTPATVSIPGLLPALSLNYYTMYLSKALSFFTTLRMLLDKIKTAT